MAARTLLLLAASPFLLAPAVPDKSEQTHVAASPATAALPAMPGYQAPANEWRSVEDALSRENCRDRIRQVREERGLPELERETADPQEPLMIYAVDRREDGCAVMVVAGNPEDIRPLPENKEGPLFRRIPTD